MRIPQNKKVCIHFLSALSKSNVGTVAAQRAIYKLLIESGRFNLSVSVTDKQVFEFYHPESKFMEMHEPLHPNLGGKIARNHLQWIFFNLWNLPILTITSMLIPMGFIIPNRAKVISRMKKCDVLIDLDLELFKGIPISISPALIKEKPRTLVIHNLFWSFRIFYSLWSIIVIKSAFKKKFVIGPASFGPFKDLPQLMQWMVKYVLNTYVDLILVREPYSAMLLHEIGVKNCITVADAALLIKTESSESFQINSKFTIGFAPAFLTKTFTEKETNFYAEAHAELIDELIDNCDANVILLPSSTADVTMCEKITAKVSDKHRITLIETDDVSEYERHITRLDLLVTSRMHPSIIASRNLIPFVTLVYDHKQIGLLQQLGLQSFAMPIGETSYDNLRRLTNCAIQNRYKIKQSLASVLPQLQDRTIKRIISCLES